MSWWEALLGNRWLWTAVIASTSAQLIKVFLILLLTGRWRPAAFMETGGMPSSHSAMVGAICTGIGITQGFGSPIFAVAAVFGSIVMYDATGVRHSSGVQAKLLNELIQELKDVVREGFAPQPIKVLLGHTYLEVAVGFLIGVGVGLLSFQVLR